MWADLESQREAREMFEAEGGVGMKFDETVSELQVCHSAAGYYIGREYWDTEFQAWMPWSRASVEYWRTADEAKAALESGEWTKREGC